MGYQSPYKAFIFEDYSFDKHTSVAKFHYSFDGIRHFTETVEFSSDTLESAQNSVNTQILDEALKLAFYVAGTSYFKAFPTRQVIFKTAEPDVWQALFLQNVYTYGLSQFMFENNLSLEDMPKFSGHESEPNSSSYSGEGTIALQSGGKDSLLLASLLEERGVAYKPLYISSGENHPAVLDSLASSLDVAKRELDILALNQAKAEGGLNGHVPVTYIVLSYALISTVLQNKKTVLVSIGVEGGEAHEHIGDLPVNHQWSKTWAAEQLLARYVTTYISSDLQIGSPLRGFSELRVSELFVEHAWKRFGHSFSSCNRANYKQGEDNHELKWCGECPKCANSYLLFAPFVEPNELQGIFGGQVLFKKPSLTETFKGLLGIDGVMKPFECIGEVDELRLAYHMAQIKYGDAAYQLPFDVPKSTFDYKKIQPMQTWASELITTVY